MGISEVAVESGNGDKGKFEIGDSEGIVTLVRLTLGKVMGEVGDGEGRTLGLGKDELVIFNE